MKKQKEKAPVKNKRFVRISLKDAIYTIQSRYNSAKFRFGFKSENPNKVLSQKTLSGLNLSMSLESLCCFSATKTISQNLIVNI